MYLHSKIESSRRFGLKSLTNNGSLVLHKRSLRNLHGDLWSLQNVLIYYTRYKYQYVQSTWYIYVYKYNILENFANNHFTLIIA